MPGANDTPFPEVAINSQHLLPQVYYSMVGAQTRMIAHAPAGGDCAGPAIATQARRD